MERRDFLKNSALGAAMLVAGTSGCSTEKQSVQNAQPDPGDNKGVKTFELEEVTVDQLQAAMREGRQTARGILELYLKRIEEIDRSGPGVNAILELNPEALQIADQLDAERLEKGPRSLLHGIPILIKGNIDTADKMTTTAGSLALEGSIPGQDAFIVEQLRKAGAVILGKSNLSEWANFRSSRSSSGWSSQGGQTNNPYVLDRNPCGSSSGSGAGVSANMAAIAIGTETNGSIVCPSNANGVVGIKPTVGLVSRSGIIPISHTQDTAGPMARTVRDAAILLGGMTGLDPRDGKTNESEGKTFTDYTQFLDVDGLKGKRVGVARNFFGFHEQVDQLMEGAISVMKAAGAEIVDPASIDTMRKFGRASYQVLLFEFKADLNAYLAGLGPQAAHKTLADLIEFNRNNKERVMPYFQQEIFIEAQEKGDLTTKEYLEALATCDQYARKEGIDAVMAEHKLDAIVAPTGGPAWVTDRINGDRFGGGCSSAAAVAGYPHITVPNGFIFGLPTNISFFAGAWQEPALLSIAFAYEQATSHRKAPGFLETVAFV